MKYNKTRPLCRVFCWGDKTFMVLLVHLETARVCYYLNLTLGNFNAVCCVKNNLECGE
jgi:hypothetical protein